MSFRLRSGAYLYTGQSLPSELPADRAVLYVVLEAKVNRAPSCPNAR